MSRAHQRLWDLHNQSRRALQGVDMHCAGVVSAVQCMAQGESLSKQHRQAERWAGTHLGYPGSLGCPWGLSHVHRNSFS